MGAHTPACLRAASDPVETVTPPLTTPATKTCRWGPQSSPALLMGRFRNLGCEPGQLARAASTDCIPPSGKWRGPSPGLWEEAPFFLQVGEGKYRLNVLRRLNESAVSSSGLSARCGVQCHSRGGARAIKGLEDDQGQGSVQDVGFFVDWGCNLLVPAGMPRAGTYLATQSIIDLHRSELWQDARRANTRYPYFFIRFCCGICFAHLQAKSTSAEIVAKTLR
jgi:hypothetical protein